MTPTIFALASGSAHAGVAVVRVSGPAAPRTLEILTGEKLPIPRMAHLVDLKDGEKLLDRALAIYFKAPASFTGDEVVEYHLHGGRAVIDGVLSALSKIENCRLAEPGEFTRRAFENGKMDLTEAEAVADLIAAETEAQRLQALGQLGGALSKLYGGWTENLKNILAHQEADIEFPDDDMPAGLSDTLKPQIKNLLNEIAAHLDDGRRGERLREGVRIAILGAPNAGKSSLLNALSRRDAAIVSEEAGTTRDVIEVHLDLGGYPVVLADTAGLRATENKIEAEGIRRAKAAAANADLKIALFEGEPDEDTLALVDENTLVVCTKIDAYPASPQACSGVQKRVRASYDGPFSLSARTGEGLDDFLKVLTQKTASLFAQKSGPPLTRARHRAALEEAKACLERTTAAPLPELAAEDLRLALRALGRITGKIHVEEVLDAVFRDFCIGK
jgi:tRNA modification GTPase